MDKKCPNCGNALPEEASFCMHCFTPLNVTPLEPSEAGKNKSKKFIALILFALCLCAVILISTFICVHNSKSHNDNTTTSAKQTTTISNATTKQTTTIKAEAVQKTTVANSTTKIISTTASTTAVSTSKQQKTTKATTKQTTTKKTTTKKTTTIKTTAAPPVIIDSGILINYPAGRTNSSYTVPYSVTKIAGNAFNNNKYLKTLKFSRREAVECDWGNLFSSLPNLETVYVYPGTSADLEGLQYFDGEIVYYD